MASVRPAAGPPRRASIRAHLVRLVLAAALPLAALEAWDLYAHARDDAERARAQVLALAEITASETARFLGQAQNILKGLAARPAVRALDPSRCDPILKDFLGLAPRFANVVTADADGFVVCSAVPQPGAAPRVASPAQMLRMRTAGTFVVGEPFKSPITGRWVLALAAPLHDAQGRIAGGVALGLDLASLLVLPRVSNVSANTVTGLFTTQGTVIARSTDAAKFVGTNQAHREDTRALIALRQGTDEGVGLDGLMRVRGVTPVPGTDWIAYATVPASEVYAGAKARIATHALVALGILSLALLLAVRESRAIREPIAALAGAAGEVAAGNLAVRAPVAGAAEVAEVTNQFNRMLDARAAAEAELHAAHERFQKIFHAAPMAATVSTMEDGRLLEVNDAFCALLGRSALEVGIWVDPRERAALVEELCLHGRARDFEARIRGSDGEVRDVLLSAERIEFQGQTCTLQMGVDITARKLADEKIRLQLEELNRWYQATLGREDRVQALKREVNELRGRLGEAPRYGETEKEPPADLPKS